MRYISRVQRTWWRPAPQPGDEQRKILTDLMEKRLASGGPDGQPSEEVQRHVRQEVASAAKSRVLLASAQVARDELEAERSAYAEDRDSPDTAAWGIAGALASCLVLYRARPADGVGVALGVIAALALALATRVTWRLWRLHAWRRKISKADGEWQDALRDGLEELIRRLEGALEGQNELKIRPEAAPAIVSWRDPELAVQSAAVTAVATVAGHIGAGSIGISGPRGAGKSTILATFGSQAEGDIRIHVSAPIDYDARDFLIHLFIELCQRVQTECQKVIEHVTTLSRMAETLSLMAETRRQLDRLRFLRAYSSTWGPALPSFIPLTASFQRQRTDQPTSLPAIVAELRKYSERVANWNRARPPRADVRVIICIDEMDKIRDSDRAESFLNEIKAIFDVPGCLYLVSISEDAMTVFASRTPAIRTAFDSAFDEIVSVQPMTFVEARDMLNQHVIGVVPWPFLALCHVLAGGVPRDLLRAARALIQVIHASEGAERTLREVTDSLVRSRCDIMRQEATLQLSRSGAPGNLLQPLHESEWPAQKVPGAVARPLTPPPSLEPNDLRASAVKLYEHVKNPGNDEVKQMCEDVSVALEFYATVVEVFGPDPNLVKAALDDERNKKSKQYRLIDDLARARHAMRTNSDLAQELLKKYHKDHVKNGGGHGEN
jgi:hypothetical protein